MKSIQKDLRNRFGVTFGIDVIRRQTYDKDMGAGFDPDHIKAIVADRAE